MTQPVPAMTGAEVRCTRGLLGLSSYWLARWLDVSERKLTRWETGELPVPPGVAGQIEDLRDEAANLVDSLITQYSARVAEQEGDVYLRTYRTDEEFWETTEPQAVGDDRYPSRWHRMIAARVADAVPGVVIVYGGS